MERVPSNGGACWRAAALETIFTQLPFPARESIEILGVIFDVGLAFPEHLSVVSGRAKVRLSLLARVAGSSWGWHRECCDSRMKPCLVLYFDMEGRLSVLTFLWGSRGRLTPVSRTSPRAAFRERVGRPESPFHMPQPGCTQRRTYVSRTARSPSLEPCDLTVVLSRNA